MSWFKKIADKDNVPNQYDSSLYKLGLRSKDEGQIELASVFFTMAMEQGYLRAGYELIKLETQKLFSFK